MKIGKYQVGLYTKFMWQDVKDVVIDLWSIVYQSHTFSDGKRMVVVGPLKFAWKP